MHVSCKNWKERRLSVLAGIDSLFQYVFFSMKLDVSGVVHSCQPLLGVNLSPVLVHLYFPYAGQGLLFFRWWQRHLEFQRNVWQWKEEAVLCKIHMRDFRSHFWWLAYCVRPVRVHLVMAFVGCSFNGFSIFLLSLKQQQNLMKIMFYCIHFPILPYPPQMIKKKTTVFYTGKLYGLTGMVVCWKSYGALTKQLTRSCESCNFNIRIVTLTSGL